MKLDEAKKHLNECMSETEKILYPEVWEAHKLGIAALRDKKYRRITDYPEHQQLLPGETE